MTFLLPRHQSTGGPGLRAAGPLRATAGQRPPSLCHTANGGSATTPGIHYNNTLMWPKWFAWRVRGLGGGEEEMSSAWQTLCSSAGLPAPRSSGVVFADLGFTSRAGWVLTRSSGEAVPGRRGVGAVLTGFVSQGVSITVTLPWSRPPSQPHGRNYLGSSCFSYVIHFSLCLLIYWEMNCINRMVPCSFDFISLC